MDNFDLHLCCCQVLWHISSCLLCLCFSDVLCNMSKQKASRKPWSALMVWHCVMHCELGLKSLTGSPSNRQPWARDQHPEQPNSQSIAGTTGDFIHPPCTRTQCSGHSGLSWAHVLWSRTALNSAWITGCRAGTGSFTQEGAVPRGH